MNDIHSLISQQTGFTRWKSYDVALGRLRCSRRNEYSLILPNNNIEWSPDIAEPPIFACKFSQKKGYEHILALANEDGKLAIHNTRFSTMKQRFGCDAHRNAIFDLAWMFDQMKLVTVSGDHSASLHEISESEIRSTQVFEGHTRSVKTVTFRHNDSNVFATGGRDGTILTWDTRSTRSIVGKVDCCLFNTHRFAGRTPSKSGGKTKRKKPYLTTTVSGADSVTGLVFQDEYSLISCGAGDGIIKVWDMRKTYANYNHEPTPKFVLPYGGNTARNGFSNLLLDRSCMKLYANCLDNNIYCYNVGTYEIDPFMRYFGHENSTFYIKACLSPNGRYLISGSSDNNAYVWDVATSTPLVKLTGHQAEVTCVAWSPSHELVIVTCSDDLKHKFWTVGNEELPDNWEVEGAGVALKINPLKHPLKHIDDKEKDDDLLSLKKNKLETDNNNVKKRKKKTPPKKEDEEDLENEIPNKRIKFERTTPAKCKKKIFPSLQNGGDDELEMKRLKFDECRNDSDVLAVIADLPNFVLDGRAPHLNLSPLKKMEKDWLTKIRVEKSSKDESEVDRSAKNNRNEQCLTPKSRYKNKSALVSSPHSPLLKFFKVTSNNVQTCSPKSSNLNCFSPIPSTSLV